jgi:dephospho-CoA kinase
MNSKILILGKCGSGKSTVSDYLVEKYNFKRYSFAEAVKSIGREIETTRNMHSSTVLRAKIEELIKSAGADSVSETKIFQAISKMSEYKAANPTKRIWGACQCLKYVFTGIKPEMVKNRGLLQNIGMYFRQDVDQDVWVKFLYKKINSESKNKSVAIDDARFQNELNYFKGKQYKVIRVVCDIEKRKERMMSRDGQIPTESQMGHISETDLDSFGKKDGIIEINNDGNLEDLYKKIDKLMEGK